MTATRPAPGWSLEQWLAWLEQGPRGGIVLGLDRVARVLDRLAPAARPTLTVAGTNGKGSCAHFAAQLAHACGRRVGLYTSPHLLDFGERIRVDGVPCERTKLIDTFARVEAARGDVMLTYFEFTTLAALCLFDDADVDLRVLEVGLGGRLDAVNAIDADACVITSIGLDHVAELGDSLDGIAREKAGVARPGRAAVMAMPEPPVALREALDGIGARSRSVGVVADAADGGWRIDGFDTALPAPVIAGDAVRRNLAAAAIGLTETGMDAATIAAALPGAVTAFSLPGRQQAHGDLILDIAHNVEAAGELAAALGQRHGRWRIVLGMLADKPVEGVAQVLAPLAAGWVCTGLPGPRGMPGDMLAGRVAGAGMTGVVAAHDVAEAVAIARASRTGDESILVTGSFLTVAGALRA